MSRSRRSILAALAAAASTALAGCGGGARPEVVSTSDRTAQPTDSLTDCSVTQTEFAVPDVSKPTELTANTVVAPVIQVEQAYEGSISLTAETVPGVPDDATLSSFRLRQANPDTVGDGDEFEVTVRATASYQRDSDTSTTQSTTGSDATTTSSATQYDRALDAATYRVTTRRIERESGVGDLTGPLVCW